MGTLARGARVGGPGLGAEHAGVRRVGLRCALALVAAMVTGGCTTWRTVPVEATPHHERVRILTADARSRELSNPRIEDDTLVVGRRGQEGGLDTIRVSEVMRTEGRVRNIGGTVSLVLLGAVVFTIARLFLYAAVVID